MKIIALISIAGLLAACGFDPSTPQAEPVPVEVCKGKLEKVTDMHLRMTCDDGRVINYTSYKYPMNLFPAK